MIVIPEVVRNKATFYGAEGWVEALPGLVGGLAEEWSFTVAQSLDGGTESFVAEVEMTDGTAAVLKVRIPQNGPADDHEIAALRLADGEGCPKLYRADEERLALLMEKLGRPLGKLGLPSEKRHAILVDAASRMWRPVRDAGFPTGAEKGRWLADFIIELWERLDRPCAEKTVAHALACLERRVAAHDDDRAVLVHGDVHQWNALEADDGFKLVDPDGLVAEAEHDLGIIMREDPEELLDGGWHERAARLAVATDLDPVAIHEWGVAERVSTGLFCTEVDLQPVGRQMLAVADLIAAEV